MFLPGIDVLLLRHPDWLRGRRFGLITHQAALGANGLSSAHLLRASCGSSLAALFGPEHGFYGTEGAGELTKAAVHQSWHIPIHSLYGKARKPTQAMLEGLDALVFDLQDIGVRCYTYGSTLRLAMEAAAEAGLRFIVADRPVPLPNTFDGPITEPELESFVAMMPAPLCTGMTPGETALLLKNELALKLDLRVARMRGYRRSPFRPAASPPWIPPSPGIASWESAACYPATVFTEAFPAISCGRRSPLPFQLIAGPANAELEIANALQQLRLPGLTMQPYRFKPAWGDGSERAHDGVRLLITDHALFRPALAGVAILHVIQKIIGKKRLWSAKGARPEWFDKLYGADAVRRALIAGKSPSAIAKTWEPGLRRFEPARKKRLLYRA